MRLGEYARAVIARAEAYRYASDEFLAGDPLIRPFGILDRMKRELRNLQESTRALCWVGAGGEMIPFDENEFAAAQSQISTLQAMISHNEAVLAELEDKVQELGVEEYSLLKLRDARRQLEAEVEQIRTRPERDLAHKWHAIVEINGSRQTFETLPEVKAAREAAAKKIEPILVEICVLDARMSSLEEILRKLL